MADNNQKAQARFSQSRNDLYWSHFDLEDSTIRWIGYNDDFWWHKVSVKPEWTTRVGTNSGRSYTLDPQTGEVFITTHALATVQP